MKQEALNARRAKAINSLRNSLDTIAERLQFPTVNLPKRANRYDSQTNELLMLEAITANLSSLAQGLLEAEIEMEEFDEEIEAKFGEEDSMTTEEIEEHIDFLETLPEPVSKSRKSKK